MLDEDQQPEQPAAMHVNVNAGIVQSFVRPDLSIGCFIPPLDAEEAADSWER